MPLTFSVPDTELSLTLHNRRAEVVDNIFKGTPFMFMMSRMGGVTTADGGIELVGPVLMSKNTTAGSFTDYDPLDTTPQNNETSYRYPWAGGYASIAISWMEERRNSGRGRLVNLLNQKIDDAMLSLKDKINVQLLAPQPAAGSKDPIAISELIDDTPTADPDRVASIGNIGNANVFWRNQTLSGGPFTVADMNTFFNTVSDGSDNPTFLLTNQTVFEFYENSQVGLIRYADSRVADAGFTSLQFKGVPIMWDPQIGTPIGGVGSMYFINTKYLKLNIHPDGDFVTTDFKEPDNQAAKVAQILWMGNMICTNRRRTGIIHTITAPA